MEKLEHEMKKINNEVNGSDPAAAMLKSAQEN